MAAVKALQQWCKIQCEGYRDVAITNMTTSFRDGLAFCALLHRHRPDLLDFDSLSKENVYENNHLAFRIAEEELGIPALLDAEDMVALKVPDRLSILTYVSQYYNYFHGRNPIGGMGGIKRPATESNEERPGKKNQPVTAKVFSPPKEETEKKKDVLVERSNKSGTLSSNCNVCNKHVHLVQRHLVDGKLYHRNCFKCSECSNILLSGTYKPGKAPNTFMCKTHSNTLKPPSAPATQVTQQSPSSKATPAIRIRPSSPTIQTSPSLAVTGLAKVSTPYKSNNTWLSSKTENFSSPTPTPRSKPPTARSEAPDKTVKSPQDHKPPAESPKPPSNTVKKTQEARQRFFESSTSPGSTAPVTKLSKASPINEKFSAKTDPPKGAEAGKGRVLLRPSDWTKGIDKEKEKENEKEKAKSVISKLLIEDTNKSSSSPWQSSGLKITNTSVKVNVSPVDPGSKSPSGRIRLEPLEADLDRSITPPSNKTPSWVRTKDNDLSLTATTPLSSNKETGTAPSDWRSMLKPIAKDTKSGTPKPFTSANVPNKTAVAETQPATPSSRSFGSSGPAHSALSTISPSSEHPRSPVASPCQNETTPHTKDSKTGSHRFLADTTSEKTTPQQSKLNPNYIPKEEIMQELNEIEMNLDELEKKGVELEKQLRNSEEEGEEDTLMNNLMVDWFNLIRNKQIYMRRESELVYIARTQDLEEEQPNVEAELRKLMEKPDRLKTPRDRKREEELMAKLVEIVNDRNAIVDGLDEDRLREDEEDEQLKKMLQSFDIKKEKKKKSPISKLFGWRSKAEATGS